MNPKYTALCWWILVLGPAYVINRIGKRRGYDNMQDFTGAVLVLGIPLCTIMFGLWFLYNIFRP